MGTLSDRVFEAAGNVTVRERKPATRRANEGYQKISILPGAKAGYKEESGNTWVSFPVALIGTDGNTFGRSSLLMLAPKNDDKSTGRFIAIQSLATAVGYNDIPTYPRYDKETKTFSLNGKTVSNSEAAEAKAANQRAALNFFAGVVKQIEEAEIEGTVTPFVGVEGYGELKYKDETDIYGTVWSLTVTMPEDKTVAGAVTT